jgi:uncharacterized protein YndB with AHSA1/START domain
MEDACMRYYEASAVIEASPELVWDILVDGTRWPTWDSGVEAVEGRIAAGETVTVRSRAAPGRAFPVTVTEFSPPVRLQFSGGMPLGLFRGVRTYEVRPDGGGGSRFGMREEYTGLLLRLMWRSMPDLQVSFDQFARGLKRRVEGAGSR